jgi:hypothetical protein
MSHAHKATKCDTTAAWAAATQTKTQSSSNKNNNIGVPASTPIEPQKNVLPKPHPAYKGKKQNKALDGNDVIDAAAALILMGGSRTPDDVDSDGKIEVGVDEGEVEDEEDNIEEVGGEQGEQGAGQWLKNFLSIASTYL